MHLEQIPELAKEASDVLKRLANDVGGKQTAPPYWLKEKTEWRACLHLDGRDRQYRWTGKRWSLIL